MSQLKQYLPLIEDSPVYPVIYDSNGTVLSLPPIINGEHSKLSLSTKNVFIESTSTDITKAKIVLNTLVSMFSEYCAEPFTMESVKIEYYADINDEQSLIRTCITPDFDTKDGSYEFQTDTEYINHGLGTQLTTDEIVALLYRMSLPVERVKNEESKCNELLIIRPPPTRSDILHAVDIMEDVAIAFGYNNIQRRLPIHSTTGLQLPINSFSDKIRACVALCGFDEVLNWVLLSKKENFEYMRIEESEKIHQCVQLIDPKARDLFEICRTKLLPVK